MISDAIRMALAKCGKKQTDIANQYQRDPSIIYSKMHRSAWSGCDLVRIADLIGAQLAFVFPDGERIHIYEDKPIPERNNKDTNQMPSKQVVAETVIIKETIDLPRHPETSCEENHCSSEATPMNNSEFAIYPEARIQFSEDLKTEENKSNFLDETNEPVLILKGSDTTSEIIITEDNPQEDRQPDDWFHGDCRPIEYVYSTLPNTPLEIAKYISSSNKLEIVKRAEMIVKAEAPIRLETLMMKIWSSFGIKRQSQSILDATKKALRAINNIESFTLKSMKYYWYKGMNPSAYKVFRVSPERECSEICPYEIMNAVIYTLNQNNGEMDRDELIISVSRNLGYKRCGKNVKAAINTAIQFGIHSLGTIEGKGQISLKKVS